MQVGSFHGKCGSGLSAVMPKPQGDAPFLLTTPYSCPTAAALLGPGVLCSGPWVFGVLCGTGTDGLCLRLAKRQTWL